MAERQAQLPRTRVGRLLNTVQQRGRRSKTDAWLLGVSCSVLLGQCSYILKKKALAIFVFCHDQLDKNSSSFIK